MASPIASERPLFVVNHDEADEEQAQFQPSKDLNTHHSSAAVSVTGSTHFADFDGVHIRTDSPDIDLRRSDSPAPSFSGLLDIALQSLQSEQDATIKGESVPYVAPGTTNSLTYYPAPVPVMINLPPKISKRPSPATYAKRRSQMLASQEIVPNSKAASNIPAQLRASLFFDQPLNMPEIMIDGGTPTEILEQILESSVYAPTDAFSDHAFLGDVSAIYDADNSRHSRSTGRIPSPKPFYQRASESVLSFAGFQPTHDSNFEPPENVSEIESDSELEDSRSNSYETHDLIATGQPNTLMAELQSRKQRQKARNRPALEAFPNGVYSTLLELDAVAQIDKSKRQQQKVNLAWEQSAAEDAEEDLPLGVLYQDKRKPHRLATTEADSGSQESLYSAGTRNMNSRSPSRSLLANGSDPNQHRGSSRFGLEIPGLTDASVLGDTEEETLGQRRRRLQGSSSNHSRAISGDFASETLSQLGLRTEAQNPKKPSAEETLGQRKKRLQAERQKSPQPISLAMHPVNQSSSTNLLNTSMAEGSRNIIPLATRILMPTMTKLSFPQSQPMSSNYPFSQSPGMAPISHQGHPFSMTTIPNQYAFPQQFPQQQIPMASPTWNMTSHGQAIQYGQPVMPMLQMQAQVQMRGPSPTTNTNPQVSIDHWRRSVR